MNRDKVRRDSQLVQIHVGCLVSPPRICCGNCCRMWALHYCSAEPSGLALTVAIGISSLTSRLSARGLLRRPVQQGQVQWFWDNGSCMLLLVYRFRDRVGTDSEAALRISKDGASRTVPPSQLVSMDAQWRSQVICTLTAARKYSTRFVAFH